jgi:hypothetical protein
LLVASDPYTVHPFSAESGPNQAEKIMAQIGRTNSLQVVKQTDFGLYLDGGPPAISPIRS